MHVGADSKVFAVFFFDGAHPGVAPLFSDFAVFVLHAAIETLWEVVLVFHNQPNFTLTKRSVKCQVFLIVPQESATIRLMNSRTLHPLQEKILQLAQNRNIAKMSLREIGELVGDHSPQKIKHHIQQLEKRGLLKIDRERQVAIKTMHGWIDGFLQKGARLLRIPIVGAANCGPAEVFAEENVVGYLRISNALLRGRKTSDGLFALRADGFSMNQAKVNSKKIDDGDLLIIDSNDRSPHEGEVILSIIDGAANIKRYHEDRANNQVVLMSESSHDFSPIYIHADDDFFVNGKVIDVVKRPRLGD